RPLTPGQVYELELEVWPMCIVLPAGFRIAVNIAGRDFERPGTDDPKLPFPARGSGPWMHNDRYDRPTDLFAGNTTLHTGSGREAYLLLPLIPTDGPGVSRTKPTKPSGKAGQIGRCQGLQKADYPIFRAQTGKHLLVLSFTGFEPKR